MEVLPIVQSFATASTSAGGYATPPRIWIELSSNKAFQVIALSLLVWQNGRQGYLASLIIAVIFMIILEIVKRHDDYLVAKYKQLGLSSESYYNPRMTA